MTQNYIETFKDRAKGAMYGVAVGDALGAPLEFMTADEIKRVHGKEPVKEMIGGGWLDLEPGMTTDDTDMTLAVAEGIAKRMHRDTAADVVEKIGEGFIKWHHSRPKDIGHTCRMVIEDAERRIVENKQQALPAWAEAAMAYDIKSNQRSGGNGALMRTVPVGIAYADPDKSLEMGRTIAQMTHWDDAQAQMVGEYSQVIGTLVRGASRKEISQLTRQYYIGDIKPTGYSFDSLDCALYAINRTRTFKTAVIKAVNFGGDADTIGAITGGLIGAATGYKAIPKKWVDALPDNIKVRIDRFVDWAVRKETERCQTK